MPTGARKGRFPSASSSSPAPYPRPNVVSQLPPCGAIQAENGGLGKNPGPVCRSIKLASGHDLRDEGAAEFVPRDLNHNLPVAQLEKAFFEDHGNLHTRASPQLHLGPIQTLLAVPAFKTGFPCVGHFFTSL